MMTVALLTAKEIVFYLYIDFNIQSLWAKPISLCHQWFTWNESKQTTRTNDALNLLKLN